MTNAWPQDHVDRQILKDAVTAYLDHKEAAEKHTALMREAAATLLDRAEVGQRIEIVPGVGVRLQKPSETFSAGRAEQIIRDTYGHGDEADQVLAAVTETKTVSTISKDLAAAVLPGAVFAQCKTSTGVPSIRAL